MKNAQKVMEAISKEVLVQYRAAVKAENVYSHHKFDFWK